jgi:hypothetical protein
VHREVDSLPTSLMSNTPDKEGKGKGFRNRKRRRK